MIGLVILEGTMHLDVLPEDEKERLILLEVELQVVLGALSKLQDILKVQDEVEGLVYKLPFESLDTYTTEEHADKVHDEACKLKPVVSVNS